jgi:2-polyprenyl-3-methyl-5-hydroxy-6-metoxy-1,4-benzoquinol methylase
VGPAADNPESVKAEELAAAVREIRERVRARYPQAGASAGVTLADLMPLVHARDAAQAKVAAIGTVNPRRGGPLNSIVQAAKRMVARLLDWHVREQVEFNRSTVACVEAAIEALNDTNRALMELGDMRSHWAEWRAGWERKLTDSEVKLLRNAAELQAAFQHRTALMEANFREAASARHAAFEAALEASGNALEKRFWADLEKIRLDYERLIHAELRLLRQRSQAAPAGNGGPAGPERPAAPAAPALDALAFAARFRGSEESVRERQRFYLPYFAGCESVLDIGCGRGEFLELMREAGVAARGIDLDGESVETCRAKGLPADQADLFEFLAGRPESTFDGIFCAQVVEHLPPDRLPDFVRLAATRLVRGGLLAIETPNPECLAIFATHFYLDPTHTRPVPYPLLAFYLEEAGMGAIEVHPLSPAAETMPSVAGLPDQFRQAFFGGLDYAIVARRL